MAEISFQNFSFRVIDDMVTVTYASRYEFQLMLSEFTSIDTDVQIDLKTITFPNTTERTADNKLNRLIDKGLTQLTHKINKKKVLFIDEQSQIPLIGSNEFGVIDRNTNILEVKPLTGCNLNCIYCSVDEGINKKICDILIDPFYLAQTCAMLAKKKNHPVEFNIGPHGEPFLYPFLEDLIIELKKIPNCGVISINTNGIMLSEEIIDTLKEAGLGRINLSLNTLDQDIADKLSGRKYPVQHIIKMIAYANKVQLPILLAPLIIPGYNDDPIRDIEPLVQLAKTITSPYPTIGFQNFLVYKNGRNPVKEGRSFEEFFSLLQPFEEKYNVVLTPKSEYNPFAIYEDKTLEKPFKKNMTVKVDIMSVGRMPSERICKAEDRIILVRGLHKEKGSANIKLVRDKHNIFLGVAL